MFRRLIPFGFGFALLPLVAGITADERITLAVPGIQCPRCIESLSGTLGRIDPSVKVAANIETKQLEVTYDPAKVNLHQLVGAVSEAPPVHNKPYEAGVLVTVEEPVKNAAKVKKALGQVKGIVNFMAVPGGTAESGDFMIILRPLPRNAKPTDHVKASQIGEALDKNGVKFTGLPGGMVRGGIEELDAKKKQGLPKTSAKSKSGLDDVPLEKAKPARPSSNTPKSKPAREPSTAVKSKEKEKDDESADKPRFVILGGDSDKVYLVDHEGKTEEGKELKKLVKEGDKFGDYIIKEVGDDEGLYVVLEQLQTKEKIRVEHKKKEKEGDKPKDHSDAKAKEASEKEKKDEQKNK
jgi:copper chaperone CopZ